MPTGKEIVYWDTCVFLAWMKDEVRAPGEMEGVSQVAKRVMSDDIILVTSILTRAEIIEAKMTPEQMAKYDLITKRSNVVPQNLDPPISVLTSEIRGHYLTTDFELLIPDAIHLATAIHYNANEFHTFDGSKPRVPRDKRFKRCGLLNLNGSVAGHKLAILTPINSQLELRLRPPDTPAIAQTVPLLEKK